MHAIEATAAESFQMLRERSEPIAGSRQQRSKPACRRSDLRIPGPQATGSCCVCMCHSDRNDKPSRRRESRAAQLTLQEAPAGRAAV